MAESHYRELVRKWIARNYKLQKKEPFPPIECGTGCHFSQISDLAFITYPLGPVDCITLYVAYILQKSQLRELLADSREQVGKSSRGPNHHC